MIDLKKNIDDDSVETDPQLIGSLMYLVKTILHSFHTVNVLSHVMSQLRETTTKHVLRYIQGIVGYGLRYATSMNLILQCIPIQI